jgi:hypothetical protein
MPPLDYEPQPPARLAHGLGYSDGDGFGHTNTTDAHGDTSNSYFNRDNPRQHTECKRDR